MAATAGGQQQPHPSGGQLTCPAKRDPRQFPPAWSEPLSQREPRTTAESHPADAGSPARRPPQGVWHLPRTTQAHTAQLAGQTSRPETRKGSLAPAANAWTPTRLVRLPRSPRRPRGAGIEDHPVDAGLPDKLDCHLLPIGAVGDPTGKEQRRLCAVVRCGCFHVAWAARPSHLHGTCLPSCWQCSTLPCRPAPAPGVRRKHPAAWDDGWTGRSGSQAQSSRLNEVGPGNQPFVTRPTGWAGTGSTRVQARSSRSGETCCSMMSLKCCVRRWAWNASSFVYRS